MQRRADTSMMRRLIFVAVVFGALAFIAIIGKLFYIQVIRYDFYQQKAISQQTRDKTLYPVRGTIYDTNMKALAMSANTEMVTLEAVKIAGEEQGLLIARGLAQILGLEYEDVLAKVEKRASYTIVKRGVERDVANQVRAFIKENKLNSIYLAPDSTRYYPYGNFLSHVLGFVGTDEQGLSGLEIQYDQVLTGTPGRIVTATNAEGEEMPFQYEMSYDAVNGNSLVLTIDEVLQHFLEKHLEIALNDNKVQNKVSGIVMDVNTGGILAMANVPDFDPNQPFVIYDDAQRTAVEAISDPEAKKKARSDALNAQWRNKIISDTYSPGSTFKIITATIGLEEKAVSLSSNFFCSGGKMVAGWNQLIKCWRHPRGHGSQTLVDAIKNSCNPAFMDIGQAIGWENFVKYYDAFGLRANTGIDLGGEAKGIFFGSRTDSDLAVLSFGQNFTVTPIQLITAVSAVANGGTLLKPHLVKEVIDQEGNVLQSIGREEVRQVISKETSDLMNDILEQVVVSGTGKNAYTVGYRVAGKTGTTEKTDKINQTGDKSLRISSFVAFAPADNPQIAVLIMLDEPTVQPVTGGVTVAPVIRRFMEEALPYMNVEMVYSDAEREAMDVTIPNLIGKTRVDAEKELKALGLSSRTDGGGDTITDQMPAPGAIVSSSAKVVLYMGTKAPTTQITVPNLKGMTVEKAKSALNNVGLYIRVTGTISSEGTLVITRQSESADSQVSYGSVITVEITDMDQQVT